ncbi:MAG: hypothetical protein V3W31_01060 [Thermodesulfobacteriota bacterium]
MEGEKKIGLHRMVVEKSPEEHFDRINEVRERVVPLLTLMSHSVEINPRAGDMLTNEELGGLGLLLKDMMEDVFEATDGLYELCKESKEARLS